MEFRKWEQGLGMPRGWGCQREREGGGSQRTFSGEKPQ